MDDVKKLRIKQMRADGVSYAKIASVLGISENTVKSYCKRHGIYSGNPSRRKILYCPQCHTEIPQTPHRKAKKYCCDKCRQLWWTAHSSLIQRESQTKFTCAVCGKTFQSYQSKPRKYCSRLCYGKSRGKSHEQ